MSKTKFYKRNETDTIFWVETDRVGEHLFTFDKSEYSTFLRNILGNYQPRKKKYLTEKTPNGQISSKTGNDKGGKHPAFCFI